MRRRSVCLLLTLLLFALAACGSTDIGGAEECSGDAACGPPDLVVPEVEHMELRQAWKELVAAGAHVEFKGRLVRAGYESYALNSLKDMDPEPWVGDIDPEPGSSIPANGAVTVTAIECPNRAASCD